MLYMYIHIQHTYIYTGIYIYIYIYNMYVCSVCIYILYVYVYVVYECGSNCFFLHSSESFQYSHLPTLFLYISHILLIISLYYIMQIYQKYCFFTITFLYLFSYIYKWFRVVFFFNCSTNLFF
jgi:hypothetical protein